MRYPDGKIETTRLEIAGKGEVKHFFLTLTVGIFTVFWTKFIGGQSVTQRSMGREAPRYPPQYPGS